MARRGTATHIVQKLKKLGVTSPKRLRSASNFFDASLDEIASTYRCEYVYKAAIANRVVFGRHSPKTSSLAIELGVAGSIVDAAVFNGTSTAYEIKTEYDSSKRLSTQTPAYLRAFDRVYIVTHPDLVSHYASVVDDRVGILSLSLRNSLKQVRTARSDITRIEPDIVFRMLRREEYMRVVSQHFGPQPSMPNGRVHSHYCDLFCKLSCSQAHASLVSAMRDRATDNETVTFVSALPISLRALGYATPLTRPQRVRVLNALATEI